MKFAALLNFATFALIGGANAAVYTSNFNSFDAAGSDIAGQDGWVINDVTDQYSQVLSANVVYTTPTVVSKTLNLGDASAVAEAPIVSSVQLSRAYGENIGRTSASFSFAIQDSYDPLFIDRDTFGFSFSNGGSNLVSFSFVPTTQSPDPNSEEATWALFYNVGTGPAISLNISVFELAQYRFDVAFTPNSNPLLADFALTVSNSLGGLTRNVSGLDVNPNTLATDFSVNWQKQTGGEFGSNSFIVDNLSVVPEPSAFVMLGLAGFGFAARRKRA